MNLTPEIAVVLAILVPTIVRRAPGLWPVEVVARLAVAPLVFNRITTSENTLDAFGVASRDDRLG